jgi:LuxR family maltose regulon positive regulatory protein
LAQSEQAARQRGFVHRIPDVAAAQVLTLLGQGHFAAAAQLAQMHPLPLVQARVHLAQGNAGVALAVLEPVRQQAEVKDLADERLKVLILQALARQALGEKERALPLLGEALMLAAPGGFVRLFVDEGAPLAQLLSAAAAQGIMVDYVGKLLTAFAAEVQRDATQPIPPQPPASQPLVDPLSEREIEVLRLIAQGLSNHEICQRLFLALSTVKGHNQRIFDKLQVQRRTEAVARARALGVL